MSIVKKFMDVPAMKRYHQRLEAINLGRFVLKEVGKGLSSNDFTNEEKSKLASLENLDPLGSGLTETQVQKLAQAVTKEELESKDYLSRQAADEKIASVRQEILGKNYKNEEEIQALIAGAKHLVRKVVASSDDIDTNAQGADKTIFLVPYYTEGFGTLYSEWMVIDGEKVMVGDGDVQLVDYVKKTDLVEINEDEIATIFN